MAQRTRKSAAPIARAAARVGERVQSVVARGLMALPHPVLRLIAGRPVLVDGQQLHVESQVTLRLLAFADAPSLEQLTAPEARARVLEDVRRVSAPPLRGVQVTETAVDGADGSLRARLYVPDVPPGPSPALLVYFHGGGFVTCDLNTHDNACRFLARQSGVRLLAVDYRRAPEHRFPVALDDALAAYRFAVEHAGELGAEVDRIGVGGDSAGGNLAAGVARLSTQAAGPRPAFQLLFYPWVDLSSKHASYARFGDGFYLAETELDWYRRQYLADEAEALDPRCSPLLADELSGLPAAYIATAGFDPLRDEAETYARRLQAAGVPVALRRHEGLFHGFFNTIAMGRAGREAVLEAAGALRLGLADPAPQAAPR